MGEVSRTKAIPFQWPNIIRNYESFWADLRQESRFQSFSPMKMPDLLVGDPVGTFSHYPSRCLSGNDLLSVTEIGRQTLASPEILMRYEDVQACVFLELEQFILSSLIQRPLPVEGLRQLANKAMEATRGQVDFHILWLLKHGALALGGDLGTG